MFDIGRGNRWCQSVNTVTSSTQIATACTNATLIYKFHHTFENKLLVLLLLPCCLSFFSCIYITSISTNYCQWFVTNIKFTMNNNLLIQKIYIPNKSTAMTRPLCWPRPNKNIEYFNTSSNYIFYGGLEGQNLALEQASSQSSPRLVFSGGGGGWAPTPFFLGSFLILFICKNIRHCCKISTYFSCFPPL